VPIFAVGRSDTLELRIRRSKWKLLLVSETVMQAWHEWSALVPISSNNSAGRGLTSDRIPACGSALSR